MGKLTRPKIDVDLIQKIKTKYPEETGLLDHTATVIWAIERVLALEEIVLE